MLIINDGGRKDAGFKGKSGDCAVRALAIAFDMKYKDAMKLVKDYSAKGRLGSKAISNGVYKEDFDCLLQSLGWSWHKAPIFHGRKAKYYDIKGVAILRMAKHYAAVLNGELHDSWDSRQKMIYGYWGKD